MSDTGIIYKNKTSLEKKYIYQGWNGNNVFFFKGKLYAG
jgi:hypothetical protein